MNSVLFSQAVATAAPAQPNPKLASAAHEFEASLMKEFLKPLQHDSLFSEDSAQGDEDSGGSDEALMGFGSEAMAKAISERGGFGIAKKILEHFQADGGNAQSSGKTPRTRF
jgi:Rod binding domain-containing protein